MLKNPNISLGETKGTTRVLKEPKSRYVKYSVYRCFYLDEVRL